MRYSLLLRGIAGVAVLGCLPAQRTRSGAMESLGTSEIPVQYIADRFAVAPITEQGDTLVLYTDTGGGTSRLWTETVSRLGLVTEQVVWGHDTLNVVSLPPLIRTATIPPPNELPPIGERLLVTTSATTGGLRRDGFLGRMWFADRVWVFDYPRQSLTLLTGGTARAVASPHLVPLGFQQDSAGRRTRHFPRIRVAVDGDSLDLLFDTGATVSLTDSARATLVALGFDGPAERGTSFIAQGVFERWRAAHPDWRVIEGANRAFETEWAMIEVPLLTIAGYEVGPVWFTMRSTRSFQGMSTAMDAPIEGALGGSALKYFRITVDYPSATAMFERR
jgi:hypothetical protein